MHERGRLLRDGPRDPWMAMPHRTNRYPREEVQVLAPLRIPQTRPLPPHKNDGLSAVGTHNAFTVESEDLFGVGFGHGCKAHLSGSSLSNYQSAGRIKWSVANGVVDAGRSKANSGVRVGR